MRAQSVADRLFKFLAFMFQSLPQGDNSDSVLAALSVGDYDNSIAKPTLLAIVLSGVKFIEYWIIKYLTSIAKVKAMFTNVRMVLVFVPFKIHRRRLVGNQYSGNRLTVPQSADQMKVSLLGGVVLPKRLFSTLFDFISQGRV